MATIRDIAQLAGVSQGTVSNIINGKGNVSVEKIQMVEAAMKQLNYSINAQAQQLRASRKSSKSIAVILPNIIEDRYAALFSWISRHLEESGYTAPLFLTDEVPYTEETVAATVSSLRPSGVIVATCHSSAPELYRSITRNGGKLVFVEREPAASQSDVPFSFVGFDFFSAGADLAKDILHRGYRRVGLLANFEHYSHEAAFSSGFFCTLRESSSPPTVDIHRSNLATADKVACDFFMSSETPDAIITTGSALWDSLSRSLSIMIPPKLPTLYTLCSKNHVALQHGVHCYAMDYNVLSQKACQMLLDAISGDSQGSKREIIPTVGFPKEIHIAHVAKRKCLNVLLIRGQTAKALRCMTPRFSQESGIDVNYIIVSPQEILDNLLRIQENTYFDIIRSHVAIIPRIPCASLCPIDSQVYQETTRGMFPQVVDALSLRNGEDSYAVPLDASTQMLAYRKDLFEDIIIKRQFFESTGQILTVPEDFEKFNKIAAFFTKHCKESAQIKYGCSVDIGTDGTLFTNFLHRYRSQMGQFLKGKGNTVAFSPEKILYSLRNFQSLIPYANIISDQYWDTAITHFVDGLTAMEPITINYATNMMEIHEKKVDGRIGYAPVPGNRPGLGGGALIIPKACHDYSAAMTYIRWMCGEDHAELFTYLGGTSPHAHVYKNSGILNLYPWYANYIQAINNYVPSEDWHFLDRYQVEQLFGYVLRNVFRGVLTCEEGSNIITENINNCVFSS